MPIGKKNVEEVFQEILKTVPDYYKIEELMARLQRTEAGKRNKSFSMTVYYLRKRAEKGSNGP